jgi:hypothetical protein
MLNICDLRSGRFCQRNDLLKILSVNFLPNRGGRNARTRGYRSQPMLLSRADPTLPLSQ